MAITRIGTAAVESTSITIPAGHDVGDLILAISWKAAGTAVLAPAGWTNIFNLNGTNAIAAAYKIATSNSETSGTWTTSTALVCGVYRGVATDKVPVNTGTNGFLTGSNANIFYRDNGANAIQLKEPGSSWIVAMAATTSTTSAIATAPTGLTNQRSLVGASGQYVLHDSNGVYPSNGQWSQLVSNGGTQIASGTWSFEIFPQLLNSFENYRSIKVGNGMSTGERIR